MSVKLRLKRMGRSHKAFYRLNAIDSRSPRDGRVIEQLGYYDPQNKDATKQFVAGGFRLPESKGSATWIDDDTLLVWRDFGPCTLT